MAKAKTNVQFITTPTGDDLAILPRADYERLIEDAGASRLIRDSQKAVRAGKETVLPKAVADKLANGGNPVKVLREWREMIQGELAVAVGISQNYLSQIENGDRKGPAELKQKIARKLGVPVDLLID